MKNNIPIHSFEERYPNINIGIVIEKERIDAEILEIAAYPHRHDYHSFIIIEEGAINMEVDFKKYRIDSSTLFYMHPSYVHSVLSIESEVQYAYILSIKDENIFTNNLQQLNKILPTQSLLSNPEILLIAKQAFEIFIKLNDNKNNTLYEQLLLNSCNALTTLLISEYVSNDYSYYSTSRFDRITKEFLDLIDKNFTKLKQPSEYANLLNISTAYLNESVKSVLGRTASNIINQRIALEAKRLLKYTNLSIKEVAYQLGYDDQNYFSRFFSKSAQQSASQFRKKNRIN